MTLSASGISPGRGRDQAPRQVERMAGPQACAAQRLFAARRGRSRRRRTGRSAGARRSAGPPARRRPARRLAASARILLADSGRAQRLADPPLAIAAPAERGGAGGGEGAVVDIAERRHPLDQRARPAARPRPPSRARAACARDRRRAWRGSSRSGRHRPERPVRALASSSGGRAFLLRTCFTAMFVPQSGRIMNAPRLLERRLNGNSGTATGP